MAATSTFRSPRSVAVIGAGMIGMSAALMLQRRGLEVTVLERSHVGAGASWGNAGWVSPAFAMPLPHPSTLRAGIRGAVSRSAPVSVSAKPSLRRVGFLGSMAWHSTHGRWLAGASALAGLNQGAIAAHDALRELGVEVSTEPMDPCLVAASSQDYLGHVAAELRQVRALGQEVDFDTVSGEEARHLEPLVGSSTVAALRLRGQRFVNPGEYLDSIAKAFSSHGGRLADSFDVETVRRSGRGRGVEVIAGPRRVCADVAILATGAGLDGLARPFGVRRQVQAGRGYSFSVVPARMPRGPVYFPDARVVFTPLGDRLRVSGLMEFRGADEPASRRRLDLLRTTARSLVRGVNWDSVAEEWVGSRPCTADGLPLIGPTLNPDVFVAGGHGMWGITHGPVSGQLLAEQIISGRPQPELVPFHPLR